MHGTSSDIFETHGFELPAHIVDVEAELSGYQALALRLLGRLACPRLLENACRICARYDTNAVIVSNDDVARVDESARADNRHVHGSERCLDGSLCEHRPR